MIYSFTIYHSGRNRVDSSWSKDLTPFPFHRLYYVYDGEATMIVDRGEIQLIPGSLVLLPAFSVRRSFCADFFDHSYVNFSTSRDWDREFWKYAAQNKSLPSGEREYEINRLMTALSIAEKPVGQDCSVSQSMKNGGILNYLLAPFFTGFEENRRQAPLWKALQYMEDHLSEPQTLEEIAGAAAYSPGYFSPLFRKEFGLPPIQYLLKRRLEQAQFLLASGNLPIGEISRKVGFTDPLYFSRQFKKMTGMSPREYRIHRSYISDSLN